MAHTIGNRSIYSVFGELGLPFLKSDPTVGSLEADISGRFDHYSDFGNTFNPKGGLKWTPIPELALRGTFSKGFRAPSFSENGSSAAEGFTTYTPPASFVTAHGNDGYVQPYALAQLTSANPNIKPETSQSFTTGAVVQPFLDIPLTATVDYYYIAKKGVISPSSPSVALDDYYAGLPIPAGYTVIQDNPDPAHPTALPRPIVVGAPYVNANSLITNGIDVDLAAQFDLTSDLSYSGDINVTRILTYRFTFPSQPTVEYVGTQSPYITSSGAGTPRCGFVSGTDRPWP